jgi:hypothetical protein
MLTNLQEYEAGHRRRPLDGEGFIRLMAVALDDVSASLTDENAAKPAFGQHHFVLGEKYRTVILVLI